MKKTNVLFWIATGLLIPILGIGSAMDLLSNNSGEIVTSLGYPSYLTPFLAVLRLLGLTVIVLPGFTKLKEWAYAGLTFDIVGAIYSILAFGNPLTHIIFPTLALLILFCSYTLHRKRLKQKS